MSSDEGFPTTRLKCFPLYSVLLAYSATTLDYLSLDSPDAQDSQVTVVRHFRISEIPYPIRFMIFSPVWTVRTRAAWIVTVQREYFLFTLIVFVQVLDTIPWETTRISVVSIRWSPHHSETETKSLIDKMTSRRYKLMYTTDTANLIFLYNALLKIWTCLTRLAFHRHSTVLRSFVRF